MLGFGIEADHYGLARRFNFACVGVGNDLQQLETSVVDGLAPGTDHQILSEIERRKIRAVHIGYHRFHAFPVNFPIGYRFEETGLTRIIKRKIYRVIDMSQNIDVVESDFDRCDMVKFRQRG